MIDSPAKVAVVMGSITDWETMKEACLLLKKFEIPYQKEIVSAHRSPDVMFEFAKNAESNGLQVIIAGAGGAAHLPGMISSLTTLPVLGVPIQSKALQGLDSLLSIVQMPKGVPVGTLAIGTSGAFNAGILALRILGIQNPEIQKRLKEFQESEKKSALDKNRDLIE